LTCSIDCSPKNTLSTVSSLKYCAEKTSTLTFSDFSATKAST
jgi:hypothetical protein